MLCLYRVCPEVWKANHSAKKEAESHKKEKIGKKQQPDKEDPSTDIRAVFGLPAKTASTCVEVEASDSCSDLEDLLLDDSPTIAGLPGFTYLRSALSLSIYIYIIDLSHMLLATSIS